MRFETFLHVLSHENVSNSGLAIELDREFWLAAVFGQLGIPVCFSSIALRPEFSFPHLLVLQEVLSELDRSILALLRQLMPAPQETRGGVGRFLLCRESNALVRSCSPTVPSSAEEGNKSRSRRPAKRLAGGYAYHGAGIYAGRILNGDTIPETLPATAEKVIE